MDFPIYNTMYLDGIVLTPSELSKDKHNRSIFLKDLQVKPLSVQTNSGLSSSPAMATKRQHGKKAPRKHKRWADFLPAVEMIRTSISV